MMRMIGTSLAISRTGKINGSPLHRMPMVYHQQYSRMRERERESEREKERERERVVLGLDTGQGS